MPPKPPAKSPTNSTSVGQQALIRAAESTGGLAAVARRLGVVKQRVHEWSCGRRSPDSAARQLMHETLGIPVPSWDQPLNMTAADVRAGDDLPSSRAPTPRDGIVVTSTGETIAQSAGRAQLTDLIADAQARSRAAVGPDRVKYMSLVAQLLKQLVAAEQRESDRQDDLAQSAVFLDWVGRCLDAVEPYPEAKAALEKAWGLG